MRTHCAWPPPPSPSCTRPKGTFSTQVPAFTSALRLIPLAPVTAWAASSPMFATSCGSMPRTTRSLRRLRNPNCDFEGSATRLSATRPPLILYDLRRGPCLCFVASPSPSRFCAFPAALVAPRRGGHKRVLPNMFFASRFLPMRCRITSMSAMCTRGCNPCCWGLTVGRKRKRASQACSEDRHVGVPHLCSRLCRIICADILQVRHLTAVWGGNVPARHLSDAHPVWLVAVCSQWPAAPPGALEHRPALLLWRASTAARGRRWDDVSACHRCREQRQAPGSAESRRRDTSKMFSKSHG